MSPTLSPDGTAQWTGGTWRAALTPHGALLLPPDTPADLAARLWTTLRNTSVTLPLMLDDLITGLGGRLRTMPDFAVVLALPGQRVHVALRGAPVLTVDGQDVDAHGASTWFETVLPAPTWISLRAPEEPGPLTLIAGDAVVPASRLVFGDPTPAAGDPRPEPDGQPEREPVAPATRTRRRQAAAPPVPEQPVEPEAEVPPLLDVEPAPDEDRPGDHDGRTVSELPEDLMADLALEEDFPLPDLDREPGDGPTPQALAAPTDDSLILSAPCSNGHPNPTNYTSCMVCGEPLDLPARRMARPPLGRVRVSTGEVVELDGTVIVGRSPSADAGEHLVAVPSPERLVSRNHVRLSLEEWSVLAQDLGTNNGTFLHRDGARPVRLSETSPSLLRSGDVLVLGDGISLTLEDLP